MCLALPGIILEIAESRATVEFGGVSRSIALDLVPEAQKGDYILAHAGFALQIIDPAEAKEIVSLFDEMEKHAQLETGGQ